MVKKFWSKNISGPKLVIKKFRWKIYWILIFAEKMLGPKKNFVSQFLVTAFLVQQNFGSKKLWAQNFLDPQHFRLDMSDFSNLTWPVITWLDLPQVDSTCPYSIWLDPNWLDLSLLDLPSPDVAWPVPAWLDLTCPNLILLVWTWPILTWPVLTLPTLTWSVPTWLVPT